MAKFRMNHARQGNGGIGRIRPLILLMIVGFLFIGVRLFPTFFERFFELDESVVTFPDTQVEDYQEESLFFLPASKGANIIRHQYYALSYNEQHEIADWVAYELTRAQLNQNRVRREDNYRPDPKVRSKTATTYDYRGSGYDRGHLVPVGDRKFSFEAMDETFFMSNISPQERHFNGGIWRELEELVRDWARKYRKVYVVAGPILSEKPKDYIGKNEVSVPPAFYKVVLDLSEPELKGIGFIIPNERSDEPLQNFATTIDEVEKRTNIDFFPDLMEDELEGKLESQFDNRLWQYDQKRYDARVNVWNVR
ncbi:MAG: DNA/RNA non-specific endonuclease [Bacteroidota bacterium]